MKIHRNKIVLIVSALQLLMLLSVISMVYVVSGNGRTVTLEMTGYVPPGICGYTMTGHRLPSNRGLNSIT